MKTIRNLLHLQLWMEKISLYRGEVWLVNPDPTVGAEIQKERTVVIISNDAIGKLPLTGFLNFYNAGIHLILSFCLLLLLFVNSYSGLGFYRIFYGLTVINHEKTYEV
jgi:hypothetical protein